MTSIAVENINYKQEIRNKTSKPLLWVGIMSIVMFFAGLTSAVVVSQGGGDFINIVLPSVFLVSTVIIVLSSVTYHVGMLATKNENHSLAKLTITLTMVLGLAFVFTQFLGWKNLFESGVYAVGSQSTQESSYLYLLTFLHVLHLVGGLVSLLIVLVKTFKRKYSSNNYLGLQVSITYWHFLGGLWVYLFLFLKYIIA